MGDAGRDHDPVVRLELARLDDRRARRPSSIGRTSTSATKRPAARDDPVVELAAVEVEAAQDAGRRGRQVGLDERRRDPVRARVAAGRSAERARRATARGTSRARRRAGRSRRSGRRAAPTAARSRLIGRPRRAHAPGRARSRPSRRARAAAARRTAAASARGRPSAAGSTRAPRSTPGRASTATSSAEPPDDVLGPQRRASRSAR